MHELAKDRGGLCLSKRYINCITHLKWKCKEGHTWKAKPNNIKHGKWCPQCSINKMFKYSIEDMQQLAKKHGGKCLSKKYINNITELKWQCKHGHTWETKPVQVRRGNWCPQCAGVKPDTIKDMQKLAKKYKGKCLSKEYINANTHLEFECKEGHRWLSMPRNVKEGRWCKKCYWGVSLKDAQDLAKTNKGKCISKEYINCSSKLKWQCKNGHRWDATYTSIRTGHWCPRCSGKNQRSLKDCQEIAKKHGGKCLSKEYVTAKTPMKWECKRGHRWVVASQNMFYRGDWCRECSLLEKKKDKPEVEYNTISKSLNRNSSSSIRVEADKLKKKLAKKNIVFDTI